MKLALLAAGILLTPPAGQDQTAAPIVAPPPAPSPSPTAKRPLPKAEGISVAAFLRRWRAMLELKELMRFSTEPPKLAAEILEPVAAYRKQLDDDRAAGRAPRACPPRGTEEKIDGATITAELEKIPDAERGMSMREAIFAYLDRRYPCR